MDTEIINIDIAREMLEAMIEEFTLNPEKYADLMLKIQRIMEKCNG